MEIALSHVGTHIADLRNPPAGIANLSFYGIEFRAWQTSLMNVVGANVKFFTLPGGYTVYSQSWPSSDLNKNAVPALSGYLANWVGLTNPPKQ
jgi:hypothetical protein